MVTMKVLTQWEFPENSTDYLQKTFGAFNEQK